MFVRAYCRASTDKQIASTDQQHEVCRDAFDAFRRIKPAWANAQWGGHFPDGAEDAACRLTKFRERHFGSLILAASHPGDVIIVSNYDRIFANIIDVCETLELLRQRNVGLVILDADIDTTTIVGEFCFKILALVKEMEVKEIRRRTRESVAYRKRAGKPHNGKSPIGWTVKAFRVPGGNTIQRGFVADHHARRLAKEILNIRTNYGNVNQARQFCNAMGIRQKNGRPWTAITFRKWCRAAQNDFPLHNGSHTPCPIPADAQPVTVETISADD